MGKKLRKLEDILKEDNLKLINHNPRFTAVNYNILAAEDLTNDAKVMAMILIDRDLSNFTLTVEDLIKFMGLKVDGTNFTIGDLKDTMTEIQLQNKNFFKNFKCENLYKEVFEYDR